MKTILIVEDDLYISDMVASRLEKDGYRVIKAFSGTEALLVLSIQKPDIVLLDLMLPGLAGEDVLPKIQQIPVIIMSAKTEPHDKVNLLLNGAADYITKPFNLEELLARIVVQLRQVRTAVQRQTLTYEEITLDTVYHKVTVNTVPIKLTRTEFAILKYLMHHQRQVVTKSQMLDFIATDTPDCTESTLKVHISNLRIKLREASNKEYIQSVWGIGFKLELT